MWFDYLVWGWIATAIITFGFLLKIKQPYGRHTSSSWGPMISNNWGWFWMELPAMLIMPWLSLSGEMQLGTVEYTLVGFWLAHYINRTLIFPLRIKTRGKKMPLAIVLSAIFFNAINGFVNGYYLGNVKTIQSEVDTWFVIGLLLFALGMQINQWADNRLIQLRKESDGYSIPIGGLYRWVSCPNYLGEIIEWVGFAIVAVSWPAASFAIWTAANLIPRALNHHDWYHTKFETYPKERKAVIPYLV